MTDGGYDASELMRLQADAILEAASRLDHEAFARAVDLIVRCAGKVVVSGAGKSGIIGEKVTATLTSTGSAAVFLHPSDAMHGGLGIVTEGDVAIFLSNSGETDELLAVLPHFVSRKVPIIGILGDQQSSLAQRSDVVLDAFAAREACHLNLAPTSSTSVALALGDALAISVMQVRGLTPADFAFNHPSGQLGKRLTLKVDDVMHQGRQRPVVAPEAGWIEIVAAISGAGLGAVTVEEADGALVGIVTDGDLRRTVQRVAPEHLGDLRASQVMTRAPISVASGTLAFEALRIMEERASQISVLPVTDELGHCVGLLRLHDVIRSGI